MKDAWLGSFYGATRIGGWLFVNTEGSDMFRPATQAEFGYRWHNIEAHIGGDIISVKNGADEYYLYGGAAINF